jgi:hypothetical protein
MVTLYYFAFIFVLYFDILIKFSFPSKNLRDKNSSGPIFSLVVYILYINLSKMEIKRVREGNGYLFHANAFRKFDLTERQTQADNIVFSHPFHANNIF